jgi:hypothetical protein
LSTADERAAADAVHEDFCAIRTVPRALDLGALRRFGCSERNFRTRNRGYRA